MKRNARLVYYKEKYGEDTQETVEFKKEDESKKNNSKCLVLSKIYDFQFYCDFAKLAELRNKLKEFKF